MADESFWIRITEPTKEGLLSGSPFFMGLEATKNPELSLRAFDLLN